MLNESVSKVESDRDDDDDVRVHRSYLPSISTRMEHFTKINARIVVKIDYDDLRIGDTHT